VIAEEEGAVDAPGSVTVVASGSVGPYDYEQIAVAAEDDDPAQAAIDWLDGNGYDVGSLGPTVLRPYLVQGMNLLAFRLSKDSDTGSIRPVYLTYPGERPLIPIQPTAVAANDDMGVLVWVLGSGRAVPTSYLGLELNEARIDWFNPNPTYNDVVIAAANEAGGNGFVTEQSGPAGEFSEAIFPDWKLDEFEQLRANPPAALEELLLAAQSVAALHYYPLQSGFGGPLGDASVSANQNQYDGFLELLSDPEVVPLRDGATPEQLNACVSCYFAAEAFGPEELYPATPFDPETDPILSLNVSMFFDQMQALVVEPMQATRELFDNKRQVTRLYTTMSANEMTIDPEFDLNAELEDVSNRHVAERILTCDGNDWTVELPSGVRLSGSGSTWPITEENVEMPYNLRVLQLSTSGEGEVLLDNTDLVMSQLVDLGLTDLSDDDVDPTPAGDDDVEPSPSPGDDDVDPTPAGDDDVSPGDDDAPSEPADDGEPRADAGSSDTNLEEAVPARTSGDDCSFEPRPAGGKSRLWPLAALALAVWVRRRRTEAP
jgi:MYXO-CTERM domain-containing protein